MTPHASIDWKCLVIGWGNDLRGDDGAGVCAAKKIAGQSPQARVIVAHQLTPELANDIATAQRVVFIDAYPARDGDAKLSVERISAASAGREAVLGHRADAAGLLRLASELYGCAPEAWLVGIPAFNFELGSEFSAATSRGIDEAASIIGTREVFAM